MTEQFVSGFINSLGFNDCIALDIGANHGMYTIPLADKFKKVYAFEPVPNNVSILKRNLSIRNITNVEVVEKVISNVPGTMEMTLNPHNMGGHTINKNVATHQEWGFVDAPKIEVPAITLDEFCKDLDVQFMKIDIEGAEDFIFEGATETLKRDNLNIMIEVHNEVDREKLFKLFKDNGFNFYGLGLYMTPGEKPQTTAVPVDHFIADNHYLLTK